jgi:amino acid permease
VLGAIALITGSTVGAGILALPSVTAPAGFGPSTGRLLLTKDALEISCSDKNLVLCAR